MESICARLRPSCVISLPFELSRLPIGEPSGGIVVVIHCFYTDLLDEILDLVKNIPLDYQPRKSLLILDSGGKRGAGIY